MGFNSAFKGLRKSENPHSNVAIRNRIHTDRRGEDVGRMGVTGEVHTGCWWRELKERNQLEDLGVDSDNIKTDFQEVGWRGAWTGSIWS